MIRKIIWRLEVAIVGGVIVLGYVQMIQGGVTWLTSQL
jgi:hypothetical protein